MATWWECDGCMNATCEAHRQVGSLPPADQVEVRDLAARRTKLSDENFFRYLAMWFVVVGGLGGAVVVGDNPDLAGPLALLYYVLAAIASGLAYVGIENNGVIARKARALARHTGAAGVVFQHDVTKHRFPVIRNVARLMQITFGFFVVAFLVAVGWALWRSYLG